VNENQKEAQEWQVEGFSTGLIMRARQTEKYKHQIEGVRTQMEKKCYNSTEGVRKRNWVKHPNLQAVLTLAEDTDYAGLSCGLYCSASLTENKSR